MDLPKRKPTRLKEYDYSTPGAYFITICVKEKKKILSKIIVGDDALIVPQNNLSDIGFICEKYINNINIKYENISVDKYVIMPNHIHLIIFIYGTMKAIPYKECTEHCPFIKKNGNQRNWSFYMATFLPRPHNTRRKRLSKNMGLCRYQRNKMGKRLFL